MSAKLAKVVVPADLQIPDDEEPVIQFKPIEFGSDDGWENGARDLVGLDFVRRTYAVTNGVSLIFQIIERDGLEMSTGDPKPLFSEYHMGELMGLAKAACDMLANEADHLVIGSDETVEGGAA